MKELFKKWKKIFLNFLNRPLKLKYMLKGTDRLRKVVKLSMQ